jgi:DNA ligase (NAD+)
MRAGMQWIDKLLDANLIYDVADLYSLKFDDIASLAGFKEKSAKNLIDSIEKSKQQDLSRLIYALGIRHVGKYASQLLARHYSSLDELSKSTSESLKEIDGLGEKSSESIVTFFSAEENITMIKKLNDIGVRTRQVKQQKGLPLAGKKFVFTGTLDHMSRSEAADIVEELGGMIVSSVSQLTDYVILGKNPGSKYEQAQKLGVTIIKEDEFLSLTKRKTQTS